MKRIRALEKKYGNFCLQYRQKNETAPRIIIPITSRATIAIITILRSDSHGFCNINLGDFLNRLLGLRGIIGERTNGVDIVPGEQGIVSRRVRII